MRFRESIKLDRLIEERRESFNRASSIDIEKRALALAILVEARQKLDTPANEKEPPDVNGYIKFTGTNEDGRKIRPRKNRDQRRKHNINVPTCDPREIAKAIREEIRKCTNLSN